MALGLDAGLAWNSRIPKGSTEHPDGPVGPRLLACGQGAPCCGGLDLAQPLAMPNSRVGGAGAHSSNQWATTFPMPGHLSWMSGGLGTLLCAHTCFLRWVALADVWIPSTECRPSAGHMWPEDAAQQERKAPRCGFRSAYIFRGISGIVSKRARRSDTLAESA